MQTILLLANTSEEAHLALACITMNIQENPDAQHQLYFRRIMFGSFHICKGHTDEEGNKHLDPFHQLIILPADENYIERAKLGNEIVLVKNCMWITGDSEKRVERRKTVISWLLNDDEKFDYSVVDLSESDS